MHSSLSLSLAQIAASTLAALAAYASEAVELGLPVPVNYGPLPVHAASFGVMRAAL